MKKIAKVIMIVVIMMFVLAQNSLAVNQKVTKEELQKSFSNLIKDEWLEYDNIKVEDDKIILEKENEKYYVAYSLDDKAEFTYVWPIKKGITYEEFDIRKKMLDSIPMEMYSGIANVCGCSYSVSMYNMLYATLSSLADENGTYTWSSDDHYMVVDLAEGVTIERDENSKTILASEFPDRVMEYVNDLYENKQIIKDTQTINSFVYTIERTDVTEDSCNLVAKIIIDTTADFEKMQADAENEAKQREEENKKRLEKIKEEAQYIVTLKVGQKLRIPWSNGYELNGSSVEKLDDVKEFIAKEEGVTYGYIYLDSDEKRSIFITVEANPTNKSYDTYILNIDDINQKAQESSESNSSNSNSNQGNSTNYSTTQVEDKKSQENSSNNNSNLNETTNVATDNSVTPAKSLPNTGKRYTILIAIILVLIGAFGIKKKLNDYKDIK